MDIPKDKTAIAQARKLLDILESEITASITEQNNKCDNCEFKTDIPPPIATKDQEYIHGDNCNCDVCEKYRNNNLQNTDVITYKNETNQFDTYGNGAQTHAVPPGISTAVPEFDDHADQCIDSEKTSTGFLIPAFNWGRNDERNYKNIFFCELDDGRTTIFYLNSRVFTTKKKIMSIPYPVPFNYMPLRNLQNNKRTAIRTYREYLGLHDTGKIPEAATVAKRKYDHKSETQAKVPEEIKDSYKPNISSEKPEMSKKTEELNMLARNLKS